MTDKGRDNGLMCVYAEKRMSLVRKWTLVIQSTVVGKGFSLFLWCMPSILSPGYQHFEEAKRF